MAYPFMSLPTFFEFRQRLERDYGCDVRPAQLDLDSDYGEDLFRAERSIEGGSTHVAFISEPEPTVRLTPAYLGQILRKLAIPPADFGMTLGSPPLKEDPER